MDVINLCELVSLNDERGKCGGLRNHYEETETRADVAESGSVTGNDAGLIKATLLSSAVCADGFEIDNIFNDRGFMAERFVKPPVDIFLDLGFPFRLQAIEFSPTVGSQTSLGVEVYSATYESSREHASSGSKSTSQSHRVVCDLNSFRQLTYRRLTRAQLSSANRDSMSVSIERFVNPRIRQHPPTSRDPHSIDAHELRHASTEATEIVDCLRLRIFRTKASTTPAMKVLRVFGIPQWRRMSSTLKAEVTSALTRRKATIERRKVLASSVLAEHIRTNAEASIDVERIPRLIDETKIEDDLLDAITCQIMAIPMLLPSGHNIDASTLDRYTLEEGRWGRPPNDPFTGVPFTSTTRPIPNPGLKVRIDKYLTTCRDDSIPRTLGKQQQQKNPQQSRQQPQQQQPQIIGDVIVARTSYEGATSTCSSQTMDGRIQFRNRDGASDSDSSSLHGSLGTKKRKFAHHEDELRSSLDSALDHILAKSKKCQPTSSLADSVSCNRCETPITAGKGYDMQCGHAICRQCLLITDFSRVDAPTRVPDLVAANAISASTSSSSAFSSSSSSCSSSFSFPLLPTCRDCGRRFARNEVILHHDP